MYVDTLAIIMAIGGDGGGAQLAGMDLRGGVVGAAAHRRRSPAAADFDASSSTAVIVSV